jgi:hypothetical protein
MPSAATAKRQILSIRRLDFPELDERSQAAGAIGLNGFAIG